MVRVETTDTTTTTDEDTDTTTAKDKATTTAKAKSKAKTKRKIKTKTIILVLIVSLFNFLTGSFATAKELGSRLGIGFRNAYSFDLPSLAAIYYPSSETAVVGAIGIDTEKDSSKSAFSAGARRVLFKEENMNFFMGGQLSMLSQEISGTTESGFEISALFGGEFFLQGLESLGFNFESGVSIANIDKVRFRTVGDHFFRAGMIFYF